MYADDTTLFCNFDNIHNENTINNEINKVYDWLCSNKLSLNVSKTKYMCFHTSNKTVTYPKLKINSVTIDRVNDFKFLGLIISSNLKWNKHINHISIKVSDKSHCVREQAELLKFAQCDLSIAETYNYLAAIIHSYLFCIYLCVRVFFLLFFFSFDFRLANVV